MGQLGFFQSCTCSPYTHVLSLSRLSLMTAFSGTAHEDANERDKKERDGNVVLLSVMHQVARLTRIFSLTPDPPRCAVQWDCTVAQIQYDPETDNEDEKERDESAGEARRRSLYRRENPGHLGEDSDAEDGV